AIDYIHKSSQSSIASSCFRATQKIAFLYIFIMTTYIHTYMHLHPYIHAHIYIHTCIHTHTHTCVHIYIHTHAYKYTYMHIYMQMHNMPIDAFHMLHLKSLTADRKLVFVFLVRSKCICLS
ncbi:hypothetical protein LOAG_15827, partial [Loa loa]